MRELQNCKADPILFQLDTFVRNCVILCVLLAVFGVASEVVACNCNYSSNCGSYANAKAVYTGKVISSEVDKTTDIPTLIVHFEVGAVFKGIERNASTLLFRIGECRRSFTVGVDYLVYEDSGPIQSICNRTGELANLRADLLYLKNKLQKSPFIEVKGLIIGLSERQLSQTQVKISHLSKTIIGKIEPNGIFKFDAKRSEIHRITIEFPWLVEIEIRDGMESLTTAASIKKLQNRTVVEYELNTECTVCDFRQIEIITVD